MEGVGDCWTHSCVRVLLTAAAIKACVVYVDAKVDGDGGDTGARRGAKLQSNHHQQTNTQSVTGQMLFLSPNQSTNGMVY